MRTFDLKVCIALLIVISSCRKTDVDNHQQVGSEGQIYFQMIVKDSSLPVTQGLDHRYVDFTACFDIELNKLVWKRKDTSFSLFSEMTLVFNQNFPKTVYYKNFVLNDGLYRVYQQYPREQGFETAAGVIFGAGFDGVYLEKLNKTTGEQIFKRKIISSSELPSSISCAVSNVIYADNKFFFGSNNGKLYCIDKEGTIIWTNNSFHPLKLITGSCDQFMINYSNGKIFYEGDNTSIKCINAQSGSEEWSHGGTYYTFQTPRHLVTNNKYLFVFPSAGGGNISRYDVNTGNLTSYDVISYDRLVGYNLTINYDTVIYWGKTGNLEHMVFEEDDFYSGGEFETLMWNDMKYSNKHLYGYAVGFWDYNLHFFSRGGPFFDIKWQWSLYNPQFSAGGSLIHGFFIKNDKIYLVTNFTISSSVAHYDYNKTYLIILNASNGSIIKQLKMFEYGEGNIPGSIAFGVAMSE